ncbi:hypothetical protein QYF61_015121 [Mycteria americana]|uniref:Uncharacterized protein n=1 Tax=Mycteria americana TaxID=33587 RepID=A0AAN7S3U0_MYCAM|nr:hypothetical protein QYF61_015121 [Mycteria americana]
MVHVGAQAPQTSPFFKTLSVTWNTSYANNKLKVTKTTKCETRFKDLAAILSSVLFRQNASEWRLPHPPPENAISKEGGKEFEENLKKAELEDRNQESQCLQEFRPPTLLLCPLQLRDTPICSGTAKEGQGKYHLASLASYKPTLLPLVVVESDKVSPQPPFLKAKQPQLPQPLLIRLLLQTLHHLRCPSLDTLQHLNVPLVVGGPKPNTVFKVRPHQCRVQGHDHFPSPAGHAIFDTSQDAIGFLGRLGTLLAHIQAAVNQHAQVLFCLAAFQPLLPKPVALRGVAVTQLQNPSLGLVKPHTIDLGPSIQPVQVPLQSLPPLQQINTPAQLGVICKLAEGALDPFIQVIDKDIKQNWPQHRALGNTACDRPPTGVNSIHHHSLGLAIQPVLYPAKSTPVQAMSRQFLQENAVGNRVKGFTEV